MQSTLQARVVFVGESSLGALGLQTCLTEAGHVVEVAVQSRRSAVTAIEANDVNLVIIGTLRPPERAFAVCRAIARRWPDLPIIMTCWQAQDDQFVADVAYAGARACVDACIECLDLVNTISHVLAGAFLFTPEQIRLSYGVEDLTPRQIEILKLASETRPVFQNTQALGVTAHTVRNQLAEVRSKLGVHTTSDAVNRARRRGMV